MKLSALLFFIAFSLVSSADSTSIALPFSRIPITAAAKWQDLKRLTAASSYRVQHLKNPTANVTLPLLPNAGEHFISLGFGTPPQKMSLIMDTGSSLVWIPCGQNYTCAACNSTGAEPKVIPTFDPESSSSSKHPNCSTPNITKLIDNCSLPLYINSYDSGFTMGKYLSESVTLPETEPLEDFIIGCSQVSFGLWSGMAGFGRTSLSFPAQMELDSFSYCMVSHDLDGTSTTSTSGDLVLTKGEKVEQVDIKYTSFVKNPNISSKPAFQEYYYLSLNKITVGGVEVGGLEKFLMPDDSEGDGGVVVDSGTMSFFMERPVFELVAAEFERQLGQGDSSNKYVRNTTVEKLTGLGLCFNRLGVSVPTLSLGFEGGVAMDLTSENYFVALDEYVGCLIMLNGSSSAGGPAIILGNYIQQNYHIEYDLKNNRFGFLQKQCRK